MPPLPASVDGLALFLDFDGTLVDIAPRPDLVHLPDAARVSLRDISLRRNAALAFVSGRSIHELDHYLAPLQMPSAGLHGAERRTADGTVHRLSVDTDQVAAMRYAGEELVARYPGLLLEDKGIGIAVHYRLAPEHAQVVRRFALTQVAPRRREFAIQPGKMVVEIKPRRMNKGSAVVLFMNEAPFKGKTPVFVGDDLTDEKGFAAVHKMGGISIKIGAGPTRAQIRLPDVAALHAWLAQLTAADTPSRNGVTT